MNPALPDGAWEYHLNQLIPQSDPKAEFCGSGCRWANTTSAGKGTKRSFALIGVMANQRMAAVLKAKGYHYHYVFCLGAPGHVDGKAVGETLPDALAWLWRGYPIN